MRALDIGGLIRSLGNRPAELPRQAQSEEAENPWASKVGAAAPLCGATGCLARGHSFDEAEATLNRGEKIEQRIRVEIDRYDEFAGIRVNLVSHRAILSSGCVTTSLVRWLSREGQTDRDLLPRQPRDFAALPAGDGADWHRRRLIQREIDGFPRPVLARRHEVCVDAEGESGIGVAEVLGEGANARTGLELHSGVEVAEGVHAVRTRRLRPAATRAGFQMWRLK